MAEVPEWVAEYVGLPFAEHGRERSGVDCWGLIRLVLAEQFGVGVPSYGGDYASTTDQDELGRLIRGEMAPWREVTGRERAGDGVLLRVRGQPIHVGLVIAPGWMLHVQRDIDSTLERYDGPRWAKRIIGIYRHESMADAL